MSERVLFLYTIGFPYSDSEQFLWNELPVLSKKFVKIVVFPANNIDDKPLRLPGNVFVVKRTANLPFNKYKLFRNNFGLICKTLFVEFAHCKVKGYFLKRARVTINEMLYALKSAEFILTNTSTESNPVIHYSYWMNNYTLALSFLKQKRLIDNYVFRVHGFDVYEERWERNFIPFRWTCFNNSTAIFPVSRDGRDYIRQRMGSTSLIDVAYLGTTDHGLNPLKSDHIHIVTCSRIIPLKRIDLLAKALKHLQTPATWFHIGDGDKAEMDKIEIIIKQIPSHVKVVFKGYLNQEQLFDFYKNTHVTAFINVSESEGLPVSIMEAASFGIPTMATNVGGTSELVTKETGILLPRDISEKSLAEAIDDFLLSDIHSKDFRLKVRQFWRDNFYAEENYMTFCMRILEVTQI